MVTHRVARSDGPINLTVVPMCAAVHQQDYPIAAALRGVTAQNAISKGTVEQSEEITGADAVRKSTQKMMMSIRLKVWICTTTQV